jgi:hypothetical protein
MRSSWRKPRVGRGHGSLFSAGRALQRSVASRVLCMTRSHVAVNLPPRPVFFLGAVLPLLLRNQELSHCHRLQYLGTVECPQWNNFAPSYLTTESWTEARRAAVHASCLGPEPHTDRDSGCSRGGGRAAKRRAPRERARERENATRRGFQPCGAAPSWP